MDKEFIYKKYGPLMLIVAGGDCLPYNDAINLIKDCKENKIIIYVMNVVWSDGEHGQDKPEYSFYILLSEWIKRDYNYVAIKSCEIALENLEKIEKREQIYVEFFLADKIEYNLKKAEGGA